MTTETERRTLGDAWTELRGYIQQASDDSEQINPTELLGYMDELRRSTRRSLSTALMGTRPHALWWWIEDGHPEYGPNMAQFDNAYDAEEAADRLIYDRNDPEQRLRWVKVFRADNAQYEWMRWDNPLSVVAPTPAPAPAAASESLGRRRRWFRP